MYLQDTKEKLLNEFSALHGIVPPIQVTDVDFVNAGVWLQNQCNARVTIQAKAGSNRIKGSLPIYYNRYRIDEALKDVKLIGKPGDYANTTAVLKMLSDVYDIVAYEEDFFFDTILPTATSVTLTPRINAIGWLPPHPVTLSF
jgi:hypothetical protein